MAIKATYTTSDGKTFTSHSAAISHETTMKIQELCRTTNLSENAAKLYLKGVNKFDLDYYGQWKIVGEDDIDYRGSTLDYVECTYGKALNYAVELPNFFTWGAGGTIVPAKQIEFKML